MFTRPSQEQRSAVLRLALDGLDLSEGQIGELVEATGEQNGRPYGATYSDLTQRLVPLAILDAYPAGPLEFPRLLEQARALLPTAPFRDSVG
jgi:hypothetical protein